MKKANLIWKIFVYTVLSLGSVFMLFPLVWMFSVSLMTLVEVETAGVWWPSTPQWSNYIETFATLPFGRWTLNTLIITVSTIIGALISNTFIAYGFARFRAKGRNTLFMLVLATMMLPSTVTMIPLFVIFRDLGWVNTFLPLIVPAFFGNAFFIFLLRQFFMGLPTELEDAAKIDGLGTFGILIRIMLPLVLPALTAVAIFQFNGAWNDFMGPLIYLNRSETFTLALGINFFRGQNVVQWNFLMVASLVSMLPSLIIFFVGQKYFIEGISVSSGVKG